MTEAPKTFVETVNERFNSTLLISFLAYVLLLNWKAFIYLVNTDLIPPGSLEVKGQSISKLDFIGNLFSLETTFWWPLFYALLSVFVLPLLNWGVSWYGQYIRVRRVNANKKQEFENLLRTTEEWKEERKKLEQLDKEFGQYIIDHKQAQTNSNKYLEMYQQKEKEVDEMLVQIELLKPADKNYHELREAMELINNDVISIKNSNDYHSFRKSQPLIWEKLQHLFNKINNTTSTFKRT
ncbi:MAG: hypothetical protein HYZ14_15805 [Bacteroidetes bacterium]|nr:hypothetical protein [Bacteroidota bacterium]